MNNFKLVIKGILVFTLYISLQLLESIPLIGINLAAAPLFLKIIYLTAYETIFFIIILSIFKNDLKKDFSIAKKEYKNYFNQYFKYWLIMLGLMILSNLIISFINPNNIAGNEEIIRNNLKKAPIYTFLSSIIFAPFVEELVFRKGISCIFKQKYLFIVFSGLLFGGLHVFGNLSSPLD